MHSRICACRVGLTAQLSSLLIVFECCLELLVLCSLWLLWMNIGLFQCQQPPAPCRPGAIPFPLILSLPHLLLYLLVSFAFSFFLLTHFVYFSCFSIPSHSTIIVLLCSTYTGPSSSHVWQTPQARGVVLPKRQTAITSTLCWIMRGTTGTAR